MINRWKVRKLARVRWSKNAVAKKHRIKMERLKSPQAETPTPPEIYKTKPAKFDVKINIERKDGGRIQFTCHRFDSKFFVAGKFISPKEFGRRLGDILNLWSLA